MNAEMTVDLTGTGAASVSADFVGGNLENEGLVIVSVSKKCTVSAQEILNTSSKKTLNQSVYSYVPSGYRIIGISDVSLANVSNTNVLAAESLPETMSSIKIAENGGVVRATGNNTSSASLPYYYTLKAKLYCLRNDLAIGEVS